VPLASLPDDAYRYDRASHTLAGRRAGQSFRLGDRLRVAVARVDLDRRELDFRLVARGRRRPPPPSPSRRKPGRGPKRPAKKPKKSKRRGRG
jgi:ribonuclease R